MNNEQNLNNAGSRNVSNSLDIADAKEMARNVYARITGYANYREMNGIESSWFIECIAEELVKVSNNHFTHIA